MNPRHAETWLLASRLSSDPEQRVAALRQVIAADPEHHIAQETLASLAATTNPAVSQLLSAPLPPPEATQAALGLTHRQPFWQQWLLPGCVALLVLVVVGGGLAALIGLTLFGGPGRGATLDTGAAPPAISPAATVARWTGASGSNGPHRPSWFPSCNAANGMLGACCAARWPSRQMRAWGRARAPRLLNPTRPPSPSPPGRAESPG